MFIRQRYDVNPLPSIPTKAKFCLGKQFAYEEDGVLYLYNVKKEQWISTEKSLSKYNDYIEWESHELKSLYEIIKHDSKISEMKGWYTKIEYGDIYIYQDWDNKIYYTYNKPVAKGFKGEQKRIKYRAGECKEIMAYKYPQALELMGGLDIVHMFEGVLQDD